MLVFPLLKLVMPGNGVIAAISSKIDVGLVAICFTVIALLMNLAPQKEVIARVPWNTIIMIAGAGMLIAVAVKAAPSMPCLHGSAPTYRWPWSPSPSAWWRRS